LNKTCPDVASINLRITLPTVDLPQPDSPTRPKVSPLLIVKSISCTILIYENGCDER